MRKFWLIEIEGTPKAVERFEELLDSTVIDSSYDDGSEKRALRGLRSWWFKNEKALVKFVKDSLE